MVNKESALLDESDLFLYLVAINPWGLTPDHFHSNNTTDKLNVQLPYLFPADQH